MSAAAWAYANEKYTNIFQVITFFMNVTVVYAISRLPKKYPDTWKKNKFHLSSAGL